MCEKEEHIFIVSLTPSGFSRLQSKLLFMYKLKIFQKKQKKEKSDDKTWNSSDAGLISFFISSCIYYSTVESNTRQVNSLTIT